MSFEPRRHSISILSSHLTNEDIFDRNDEENSSLVAAPCVCVAYFYSFCFLFFSSPLRWPDDSVGETVVVVVVDAFLVVVLVGKEDN